MLETGLAFPTGVGMNRARDCDGPAGGGVPHGRGDEPLPALAAGDHAPTSGFERGGDVFGAGFGFVHRTLVSVPPILGLGQ